MAPCAQSRISSSNRTDCVLQRCGRKEFVKGSVRVVSSTWEKAGFLTAGTILAEFQPWTHSPDSTVRTPQNKLMNQFIEGIRTLRAYALIALSGLAFSARTFAADQVVDARCD